MKMIRMLPADSQNWHDNWLMKREPQSMKICKKDKTTLCQKENIMTTRQAEDILEHTFKQLEKMLQDESRKKSDRRQPHDQHQEKKSSTKSCTTGCSDKQKK